MDEWVSIRFKVPRPVFDKLVKYKGYEQHWWKFMMNEVLPIYFKSKEPIVNKPSLNSVKPLNPVEMITLINSHKEGRGLQEL
jgi:hypothetical protein